MLIDFVCVGVCGWVGGWVGVLTRINRPGGPKSADYYAVIALPRADRLLTSNRIDGHRSGGSTVALAAPGDAQPITVKSPTPAGHWLIIASPSMDTRRLIHRKEEGGGGGGSVVVPPVEPERNQAAQTALISMMIDDDRYKREPDDSSGGRSDCNCVQVA